MGVRITRLELENVKRVKALSFEPNGGLNVIGGDNANGKTSVLDAICFALGGEKHRPSNLQREGSMAEAYIKVELSNGLIVERKGKNASLTVKDPSGKKAGQSLLDSFVEQFAIDLPKFLNQKGKERCETLLKILGIGEKLAELEKREKLAYDERTAMGRIADQKGKFFKEMPWHDDAPETPVTPTEIMERQKLILTKNAENDRLRAEVAKLAGIVENAKIKHGLAQNSVEHLERQLANARQAEAETSQAVKEAEGNHIKAHALAIGLVDEDLSNLEAQLKGIEDINAKVRANLDKQRAEEDSKTYKKQADALTAKVEAVRQERMDLLKGADMPLPGLSVDDGELTLDGKKWDCMSGKEQIWASVAIVRKLNPECGFILIDGLEQFDSKNLAEFGEYLKSVGLQAITTRVSKGDECSIVIEDGSVVDQDYKAEKLDKESEKMAEMATQITEEEY